MKKNILIALAFFALIVAATFPLVFKITTYIPGFFSSDEHYFVIWHSWLVNLSLTNNLSITKTNLIAYPFGVNFYIGQLVCYLFLFINYSLSLLTTPMLTYNLQVFFNHFFSSLFAYFLAYHLTKVRAIGFLSGVIFGFCPYIFMRSWQHLGETYLWMMPLILWVLFRLKEKNTKRSKVFFVSSLIIATLNFGVVYYSAIILITFCLYLILYNWKNMSILPKELVRSDILYLKGIFSLLIISFLFLLPQFYPIIKNTIFSYGTRPSAFNLYHRPFEDLFEQSARPLSYFLPAVVHPVFGKFTEQFIGSPLYGMSFTEHTLYLGWTPLVLAFVAVRRWRRMRRERKKLGTVPLQNQFNSSIGDNPLQREDFYIGFFVFLVIVAWVFSQPPWWNIFGFKIYMPSFFMYKILPMFRAYCRFGIVVMLAVAVLAGFGLKFILERFKSQKTKVVVTALFCGLVLFEFWNWPPYKVIDLSRVPAVYYWIKEQPKDIVIADYPLDADSPNELYKFFQTVHEKKIINGTIPGTYANKVAQEIRRLSEPKTASILKWMGVKYVVVHKDDYLKTDLVEDKEDMEKIPKNRSLKFVKSFPPQECPDPELMCVQKTGAIDVYEVVAAPVAPLAKE